VVLHDAIEDLYLDSDDGELTVEYRTDAAELAVPVLGRTNPWRLLDVPLLSSFRSNVTETTMGLRGDSEVRAARSALQWVGLDRTFDVEERRSDGERNKAGAPG